MAETITQKDPLNGKEPHKSLGEGKTIKREERLERHSGTGRSGAPKKHGGGKGGWGSIEEEIKDGKNPRDAALDDAELDEEEDAPIDEADEQQPDGKADEAAEEVEGGRTES